MSECNAEWMIRLLPSGANPAMSDPPTTCPSKSACSKGITTRSRHGLSTASRTRMSVFPLFPSKAVAARMTKSLSVVHVRTSPGLVASSVTRARFEVDAIHVEGLRITAVQGHEDELRMLQVGQDILRPHAGERGQVAHLVVRQVGGEKVIDFVARVVLEIKDVF